MSTIVASVRKDEVSDELKQMFLKKGISANDILANLKVSYKPEDTFVCVH